MASSRFIRRCSSSSKSFSRAEGNSSISLFRAKTNEDHRVPPLQTIHDRADRIQSLAFSPHDKYFAAGCLDGSFDLYEVQKKYQNLHFPHRSSIFARVLSERERRSCLDNTMSVANIDWSKDERYFQFTGENKFVYTGKMPCE